MRVAHPYTKKRSAFSLILLHSPKREGRWALLAKLSAVCALTRATIYGTPALAALAFSAALAFAMPSRCADISAAMQKAFDAFCGLNLRYIEALFDATRTTCRITGYRNGVMILFTAEQPVFRIPAARKAWGIAAVLTAGKTIRDLGGSLIGIDYVGLTDSEQAKVGRVARLPASFAEQLQAAVHDGKIDFAAAVEALDRRLRPEP